MNGVEVIAQERKRQIEEEGFTAEHDDRHTEGELVDAAMCYLAPDDQVILALRWPWWSEWWKPKSRLRNLARAGALIAAEIDRVMRAEREGVRAEAGDDDIAPAK